MIGPDLNRIYPGDCLAVMATWPDNFVDTIITDPPYGLSSQEKRSMRRASPSQNQREKIGGFMGMIWDSIVPGIEYWEAMLRVAKPGAMLLAFGGTRTFHRLAVAIEDAGWQIRDCLMWLYGSGFPKSLDISKAIDKAKGAEREVVEVRTGPLPGNHGGGGQYGHGVDRSLTTPATDLAREWSGWGTALKPAWEPIIIAMKPLDGTFAENAEKWGVAGLNVDGGRINGDKPLRANTEGKEGIFCMGSRLAVGTSTQGRWPANLILDEEAAAMLDGQSGVTETHAMSRGHNKFGGAFGSGGEVTTPNLQSSSGGASRFFYVAKSGRAERNEGCEGIGVGERPLGISNWKGQTNGSGKTMGPSSPQANHHPTVKPLELMKYLCQLTKTPTGGIVLDPFAGSGTTLWAAEFHNRPWLGIEMNPEYVAIAEARIARERSQIKLALD